MLARDGIRCRYGPDRPSWRGTCQRPPRPGSQDFDSRGHSASGRGASFWLVDADCLGRPVAGRPVVGRPVVCHSIVGHSIRHSVVVRHPHGDADRHADAIGFPNRHADADAVIFRDRHAVVFSHRHAVAQTVQEAAQAQPQAIAHSGRAPERSAVADYVRHRRLP